MKRRVRIREVHDLEFLGWILLIFLGLLLAWASRAAALPDNRAWEMISPIEKNGGEIARIDQLSGGGVVQASSNGDAVTYASLASFGGSQQGAPTGSQYLSRRTPQGWGTENITSPTKAREYGLTGRGTPYTAFSTDLSSGLQFRGELPLPPGIAKGDSNYYLRDNETGAFQALMTSPPRGTGEETLGSTQFALELAAVSPDLNHIGIESSAALTPNATYVRHNEEYENLYDWSKADQQFHAVDILPGVTNGATAPEYDRFGGGTFEGSAISKDGSRVFWTYDLGNAEQGIYVRKNPDEPQSPLAPGGTAVGDLTAGSSTIANLSTSVGFAVGQVISGVGIPPATSIVAVGGGTIVLSTEVTASGTAVPFTSVGACNDPSLACTVRVDASQGPGESGQGEFRAASADGSEVFFTDRYKLTPDSTAGGFFTRQDLYEFDTDTGALTDLTIDHNPADTEGASVQGVLGASDDGSYVYFTAGGAFGNGAAEGAEPQGACASACNLYVSHHGEAKFIAALSASNDANDWNRTLYYRTARVTPDGTRLVFVSTQSLTGYDNRLATGSDCGGELSDGPLCPEVYLYDAAAGGGSGRLSCVSCNPSGARPQGLSGIPAGTGAANIFAIYQSRVLSEGLPGDGARVFFDSKDALVPQDKNGKEDVYQWEADGTGDCRSEAQNGGCVSLISGGTYSSDSSFVDASESGDNVFFVTGQQLVGQDTDELVDLYDARENGGIVVPPAAPVCSGTGCQGVPPSPPIFATPSSVTFNGVGNFEAPAAVKPVVKAKKAKPKVKACRRGLVRKHGKCVKRVSGKRK